MATRTYHAGPVSADMGHNKRNFAGYMNGVTQAQNDATTNHPDNMGSMMNQFSALSLPGGHIPAGPGVAQMQMPPQYLAAQEGTLAYAPGYGIPFQFGGMHQVADTYPSAAFTPQYSVPGVHGAYASYPMPYPVVPYTPGRGAPYHDRNDVPDLENRRGSYSTTESAPATPFISGTSDRGSAARVAVIRSTYNTPSPDHAQVVVGTFDRAGVAKTPTMADSDLIALLEKAPAIPKAVPAVFTTPQHAKSLDQCLENRIVGNRNVYIRGLHPTTDDALLLKYAQRFGEVEQSKAIIDTSTGACKGYVLLATRTMKNSTAYRFTVLALRSLPMSVTLRTVSEVSSD